MKSFWQGFLKQAEEVEQKGDIPEPPRPGDTFYIGEDGRMVKTPIPEAAPPSPREGPAESPQAPQELPKVDKNSPKQEEKQAAFRQFSSKKEKKKPRPVGDIAKSLAVGAGTAGGIAGYSSLTGAARETVQRRKTKTSKTTSSFEKKLQPGDIIFTRTAKGDSPRLEFGGRKFPMTEKSPIQMATGSKEYHAGLYVGKGKVYHAPGEGKAVKERLSDVISRHEVTAYRPTKAKKNEVVHALKIHKRLKGAHYKDEKALLNQGLTMLLDPRGGPKSCSKKKGNIVCTSIITKAYPKQFKKEFTTIAEMKATKGMKMVGHYSRIAKPAMQERALARVAGPAFKSMKWGPIAAAATYAGLKAKNKLMSSSGKPAKAS